MHVLGEHQSTGNSHAQSFLQLADYAAHVPAGQPLRMYVLGLLTYNKGGRRRARARMGTTGTLLALRTASAAGSTASAECRRPY